MQIRPELDPKYGNILPSYEDLYSKLKDYSLVNSYTS